MAEQEVANSTKTAEIRGEAEALAPSENVLSAIEAEYPFLFAAAENKDYQERLGFPTSQLENEADAALHEIWMARTNLPRRVAALNPSPLKPEEAK